MSLMLSFTWLPMANILFRSVPKSLMAMLALVPESMASMRCVMGAPTSMLTPGRGASFSRMSCSTSSFERLSNMNGASISETFTPKACSSSSARPVLRPTVLISGISKSSFSTCFPILSDSSSEMPGRVLTLMVNDPSLNGGRKLRPRNENTTTLSTSAAPVE